MASVLDRTWEPRGSLCSFWELAVVWTEVESGERCERGWKHLEKEKSWDWEAWRCARADWLQPSRGTALSIRLFSISLLVGFLLSRLKALTMALNRFTSFRFSIREVVSVGASPQPPFLPYSQCNTHSYLDILLVSVSLLCLRNGMLCPWKRNCEHFPTLLGPWCTAQCLTHNWLLIVC